MNVECEAAAQGLWGVECGRSHVIGSGSFQDITSLHCMVVLLYEFNRWSRSKRLLIYSRWWRDEGWGQTREAEMQMKGNDGEEVWVSGRVRMYNWEKTSNKKKKSPTMAFGNHHKALKSWNVKEILANPWKQCGKQLFVYSASINLWSVVKLSKLYRKKTSVIFIFSFRDKTIVPSNMWVQSRIVKYLRNIVLLQT